MAEARIPGPLGLKRNNVPAGARDLPSALGLEPRSTKGGAAPGPIGLRLWREDPTASPKAGPTPSKPKALIIIGTGHDSIRKGVRSNADTYFDKAALASFAAYTPSHDVTLRRAFNQNLLIKYPQKSSICFHDALGRSHCGVPGMRAF